MINFEQDLPGATNTDLRRVTSLIESLRSAQREVARLEGELQTAKRLEASLSERDLPSLFDELGITELKLEDGRKVSIKTDVKPSIPEDDRPETFAWLREHHFDSIIKREIKLVFGMGEDERAASVAESLLVQGLPVDQKEFIHPSTLASFVREQLAMGGELPDEININPIRKTIIK